MTRKPLNSAVGSLVNAPQSGALPGSLLGHSREPQLRAKAHEPARPETIRPPARWEQRRLGRPYVRRGSTYPSSAPSSRVGLDHRRDSRITGV